MEELRCDIVPNCSVRPSFYLLMVCHLNLMHLCMTFQSGIYGYGVKPAHLIRRSRAFASSPASLGIKVHHHLPLSKEFFQFQFDEVLNLMHLYITFSQSFIHGYGIPQAQVTRRSYAFASSPASLDIKVHHHFPVSKVFFQFDQVLNLMHLYLTFSQSSIHGYGIPHAQFIRRYYGFSSRPASLAKVHHLFQVSIVFFQANQVRVIKFFLVWVFHPVHLFAIVVKHTML